jgi:acyl carrier protein
VVSLSPSPTSEAIRIWIVDYVADALALEPNEIDVDMAFDRFGLDSVTAVGMTGALDEWLGRRIDPNVIYQYPTMTKLADHLAAVP